MELLKLLPIKTNDDITWKYESNDQLFNRYTQYIPEDHKHCVETKKQDINNSLKTNIHDQLYKTFVKEAKEVKEVKEVKESKKSKKTCPLDLIIELSSNIKTNEHYVKEKLIEFISSKNFQKFFGVKKTSEVMKGLTENKWNKSLVLFISFFYDVSFIYLNKETMFDKEKIYKKQIPL